MSEASRQRATKRKLTILSHKQVIIHLRILYFNIPSRRYPYFNVVVGFVWSNDPESYAGGSIATGRASHARQVKVMTQTKWDTLALTT
jgi:hypothetical protein